MRALLFGGLAVLLAAGATLAPAFAETTDQPAPTIAQAPALNHVYVVLDAATYAAIRDSRELADLLGRADGGLPDYAPPTPNADRVFFRGRRTYLEFFAPDNRFNEPVGKVGVALGYDEPAPFDALEQTWRASCGDQVRRSQADWRRSEPPTPWYDALQCDDTAVGPLAIWAMVYRPEFLRWQSGAGLEAPPRTARADVLASRRQAGQGRFEVTGVTVDVSPPLQAKLVAQLEQAGFERLDTPAGVRLRGDDWEFLLRRADGPSRRVVLHLATDLPLTEPLTLGRARAAPRDVSGAVIQFELPEP